MTFTRTPDTLDGALYAASCLAASSSDGSRTVTVLCATIGTEERYAVADGRVGPQVDAVAGITWVPLYFLERAEEPEA